MKPLQFYIADMHRVLFTHPTCFWEALFEGGII